jgi:hypothetical protein
LGGNAGSGGAGGNAGGGAGGAAGSAGNAGSGGSGGSAPVCGNNVVEMGEECEPPNTGICSDQCGIVSTQECVDCEQAGACIALSTACYDNFASDDDRSMCYSVE